MDSRSNRQTTTSTSTSPYPTASSENNIHLNTQQASDNTQLRGTTTSTANVDNNATMNLNNNPIGALSPESQRRSNIFGILHTESSVGGGSSSNVVPPSQRRLSGDSRASDSPYPARMSVGSLINRNDGQANGLEAGPNMWNHHVNHHRTASIPYPIAIEDGATNGFPNRDLPESPSGGRMVERSRLRSISVETISGSDRGSDIAVLPPPSFAISQRPGRSGSAPVAIDGTDASHREIVDVDMEEERVWIGGPEDLYEEVDAGGREVRLDDATSGEEDEPEIEGNAEGEAEPDGEDEEEEDEDEESDDDDDDEEGSIDLEGEQDQDIGDSPVFISMRNGPLGISDLLLPPAAGNEEIRVKAEPGGEHEQVQSQESDVVCVGSRDPTQALTPLRSTPLAQVINSADIISFHGSSQLQDSQAKPAVPLVTDNVSTSAEVNQEGIDTAVNLLVARPGKKKKVRAKSPSPPPPAAPKPRATIRVTFHLFDDNEGPDGLPVKVEANAGPLPDMKTEPQTHTTSPRLHLNGDAPAPLLTSPEKGSGTDTTPIDAPSAALPVPSTILPLATDAAVSSAVPTDAPLAAPSVASPTRPQAELQPESDSITATPKAPVSEHHGMEPKFRIVNFKDASIAQGKVDSDYYVSPSGWNAVETDADDDEDDDDEEDGMDVDGDETGKSKKDKKRKFRELLINGGNGGVMKSEENGAPVTPQNMGTGNVDPTLKGAAPGSILQAMMDGSDEAELARLAAELDKKYNTTSKPKRKRVPQQDDYDYKDPFIDDSELQMDEPALLHRPAKTGYYVQKGAVELIKDEEEDASPKKPKGKKQTTLNLTKQPNSTKDSPIEVDDQNGEQPKKRKKMLLGRGFRPSKLGTASGSSSRQSLGLADPSRDASNRLEALVYPTVMPSTPASVSVLASKPGATREQTPAIKPLSAAVPASTSKPVIETAPVTPAVPEPPKGPPKTLDEALSRLPEEIHAVLKDVNNITQALSDDDWDKIKAAKKFPEQFKDPMFEVGKKAVELGLVGDALYDTLPLIIRYNRFTMKKYILDKMKDYQIEYYETVKRETLPVLKAAIETTMEKQVLDYHAAQELYDNVTRHEEEQARQEGREPRDTGVPKPLKRVRWSDEMRAAYWRLMKAAENEGNFETQQADIHNRPHSTTAFSMRNQLYGDIVPLFPEGWMSNQQLSRQMSNLKSKYEKQGNLQA